MPNLDVLQKLNTSKNTKLNKMAKNLKDPKYQKELLEKADQVIKVKGQGQAAIRASRRIHSMLDLVGVKMGKNLVLNHPEYQKKLRTIRNGIDP